MNSPRERGSVLIGTCIFMLLLLAAMGLTFDLGRFLIARNEAQVFTDAAALAAASKLDGTAAGLDRAHKAVAQLPNHWSLGIKDFSGVVIDFASQPAGQSEDAKQPAWQLEPKDASTITMARATIVSRSTEIVFIRAAGGPGHMAVPARSVASSHPVRL